MKGFERTKGRQSRKTPRLFMPPLLVSILCCAAFFLCFKGEQLSADTPAPGKTAAWFRTKGGNPSESHAPRDVRVSLTPEEQAWLASHPIIRVVQDPGWPPVEFADERGNPSGIAEDYLAIIEARAGIRFERVRGLTWQEAYGRLKKWEIDMTTSVAVTPERTQFWAFTKPYMKIPIAIFAQNDVTYIGTMKDLDGKHVAVVEGYAVADWIPRDYPAIRLVKVRNAKEGLHLVQQGKVFAYIDNMLVVGYYMAKLKVSNVKIAGETSYVNAQSMAVRKDWSVLAGIVQKALNTVSDKERDEIYQKWVPIRYEHGFDYRLLWQAIAVFGLITLALVLWNRKLTREIRYRKTAERALAKSEQRFRQLFDVAPVPLCFVSREGALVNANDRFVQAFGYTMEDVPTINDWWRLAYPDPDYREWAMGTWNRAVQRASREQGDIEPTEYRVTCRDGDVRTVLISGTLLGDDFLATFFDITEHKRAEDQVLAALKEKEVLLKEIHHRVKNNLQIMSSLLNIQSRYVRDPEDAARFRTGVDRIRTMAAIHDQLYRSRNLASIYLPDYVENLARNLLSTYGSDRKIEMALGIDPLFIEIDNAIPVALIINELVSNSLKHAFPEGGEGAVSVKVHQEEEEVTLVVADNGIGFPEEVDFFATESLGMQLVVTLVEQLEGTIALKKDGGTEFRITFTQDG